MAEGHHGGYRTVARPGPGLAVVAEPGGREALWARVRLPRRDSVCANCGRTAAPGYRPSTPRPAPSPRLCVACVEVAVGVTVSPAHRPTVAAEGRRARHEAVALRHWREGERGLPGWVLALRREAGRHEPDIPALAARFALGRDSVRRILRNRSYHDPAYTPPTLRRPGYPPRNYRARDEGDARR